MKIHHTKWQRVRFIPFLWHRITYAEQETSPVVYTAWTDLAFAWSKKE